MPHSVESLKAYRIRMKRLQACRTRFNPSSMRSFLRFKLPRAIASALPSVQKETFESGVLSELAPQSTLDAKQLIDVVSSSQANEGSLGFSEQERLQFLPIPISMDLIHKPGDTEKVSAITAGANHILVLTTHGNIFTWGAGQQAQLGRKVLERHKMKATQPQKITLEVRSRKAVAIGAGIYHSFAVDDAGDVWGWGLNTMGQTGTGQDSTSDTEVQLPRKVLNLSKAELGGDTVIEISGGEHHTLFLTSGGKVYACGRSTSGQLGLADDDVAFKDRADPDFLAEPALVTFPDDDDPVVHISAGVHNNMAVTKDGALYCWGQGTQGELGVPEVEVKTPRMIVRREGGSWAAIAVSCGGQHTLGLFKNKN